MVDLLREFLSDMKQYADFRNGVVCSFLTSLLLIWINLAVGIIGSEDHQANGMFAAILAIGFLGAWFVRFKARGMAKVMILLAIAQFLVCLIVMIARLGSASALWPRGILMWSVVFIGLWLLAAYFFDLAAKKTAEKKSPPLHQI